MYMARPEYQGRFYAAMQKAQENKEEEKQEEKEVPEVLTQKEKVKEMFLFSEMLKAECMANL